MILAPTDNKLNRTMRPINLRGFKELFQPNMEFDETLPINPDNNCLSQDMIDVGYYGDDVITINVLKRPFWRNMKVECKTYDELYETLDVLLLVLDR